jgi:thiamine biosynthesis lipoprotein
MTPRPITRRRLLTVLAAAGGLPLAARLAGARPAPTYEWRGAALGAAARLLLVHPDDAVVKRTLALCVAEIARLESIFSLFDAESEISQLNRAGCLSSPSLDLWVVLSESERIARLSRGAFDPTVQPLWQLYARHFARAATGVTGPPAAAIAGALQLADYRRLEIGRDCIAFRRDRMAVTLNGIAQGYITDRIADMLRDAGFADVLVELGEVRALGHAADGDDWCVAVPDPADSASALARLSLVNEAMATSSGSASRFDAAGRYHHLFDPATGACARRYRSVTVIAARAMTADALSTALSIAPYDRAADILHAAGGRSALLVMADGSVRRIGTF